jgi:hypothetical protein
MNLLKLCKTAETSPDRAFKSGRHWTAGFPVENSSSETFLAGLKTSGSALGCISKALSAAEKSARRV